MSAIRVILFVHCVLSVVHSYAAVKGSTVLVSIESNYTFPENVGLGGDNEIRGFAWFKNGFSLENSDTDLIFNAVFPVSGTVDLNGGTVTLQEDLIFQNSTNLAGLGTIIGGNHAIKLCSSINSFPNDTASFQNTVLYCDTDLTINNTITFKGNSILSGGSRVLTLGASAEIIVDSGAVAILRDVEIRGISGTKIRCADNTATLVLDKVKWVQDDSTSFAYGTLLFKDQVSFIGTSTFFYTSVQSSLISASSQLMITDGMYFSLGKDEQGASDPLAFEDRTSVLKLNNCSLIITDFGLQLTKGTLIFDRKVQLDVQATTTEHGLIMGEGNAETDIQIWLNPGCAVWHNSGYFVYNNGSPDQFKSASLASRLIRNQGSLVHAAQDVTIDSVTIELVSNLIAPMTVESGKIVDYVNAAVILPDVFFEMSAQQLNAYTYLLNGNDQMFFTKGALPLYVVVNGAGNRLRGNGGITGSIALLTSQAELRCSHAFINNTITLNNGTVILESNLLALANASIAGPGTFNLQANQLSLCIGSINANTPICWAADNGTLSLHGKLSLSSTWTITGKCIVDAQNNRVILNENGQIVVDKNAELVIKNAEIRGLADNNIRCLDESGRITLINTNVILDHNYSFTCGAMQFYRRNSITGPYTFAYDSPQTSTVKKDAQLIFEHESILLIGRNDGNEPIEFEDSSSQLMLDNSKLRIKETGIQLLKGTVVTNRDVEVDIASQEESGSAVFGDGTLENDMKFILSPGSTARFPSGHATFNVTSGDGIKSKSKTAQMIRGSGSRFLLKQNLALEDITLNVDVASSLTIDPGKILSYSNGRIVINQGIFDLTGIRYSDTTSLLNGNHKIVLVNGSLPLATLVAGTNNSIEGNGNVVGPIILQNSAAQLSCDIAGSIMSYILLNGGMLALSSDLYFTNNAFITSDGIVNLNGNNIHFGKSNLTWNSNIFWLGNESSITMNANVDLNSTWTFNGYCTLKGQGNTINLSEGRLVVDTNSHLHLQNIKLEQINDANICCVDDTGIITLDDVEWKQLDQGVYTLSSGAMRFKNKVTIRGGGIFVYESSQTSTICAKSQLKFDSNMTFSYYPITQNKNLIELEQGSSTLIVSNASLCITVSGLQLSNGQCMVRGDCDITTDYQLQEDEHGIVTQEQEGIIFGTGDAAHDCALILSGGATLAMLQGKCTYQNVLSSSLVMENSLAIFRFAPSTIFALFYDISLGVGQLVMHDKALLQIYNDAEIIGSVFVRTDS